MKKQTVADWMYRGLEIEFEYNGKQYSIGPFYKEDGKIWYYFGQAYEDDDLEFQNIDEFWNAEYRGMKISDIFEAVPEDQVDGRIC